MPGWFSRAPRRSRPLTLRRPLATGTTTRHRSAVWLVVASILASMACASVSVATAHPVAAADAYSSAVLADNPISYWRLNDTSGTTAADQTGNDNGTITGGVTLGQPGPVSGGGSMSFDGSTGYINLGTNANLQPQQWSIEVWFRSTVGGGYIFRNRSYGHAIYLGGNGVTASDYYAADQSYHQAISPGATTYADGTWHYSVMTHDAASYVLYVDGAAVTSGASPSGTYYLPSGTAIARDGSCSCSYFNGSLAEVAVYPMALSASQIANHYQASGHKQNVFFIHGLNDSAASFNFGTADVALRTGLEGAFGPGVATAFTFFQDRGYRNPDGSCQTQPAPDQNVGPLYAWADHATDPNVHGLYDTSGPYACDSDPASAFNATKLDDDLATQPMNTTIIANSLGANAVRGWLDLAQTRSGDTTLSLVKTVIFYEGAQGGSWLLGNGFDSDRATEPGVGASLYNALIEHFSGDPNRPAYSDLQPESKWYESVNPSHPVPASLHYYNFIGDLRVNVHHHCLFWDCGEDVKDVGDGVLLPGYPDPQSAPRNGNSEFVPPNVDPHSRHEYVSGEIVDIPSYVYVDGAIAADATGLIDILQWRPYSHVNYGDHINDPALHVPSCAGGLVTPLQEIVYIMSKGGVAC